MNSHRKFLGSILTLAVALILAACSQTPSPTEGLSPQDFDANGKDDIVVGVPGADLGTKTGSGQVHVLYGNDNGSGIGTSDTVWHEDSAGVAGVAETWDNFGFAVAVGDFNDDGANDIVVGNPDEDKSGLIDAGKIQVFYGQPNGGIQAPDNREFYQDELNTNWGSGSAGGSEADDNFGFAVAVGDFNNDGYDDVVAGAPYEDIGSSFNQGMITIIYGSDNGLTATGSESRILSNHVTFARYGSAVAAGDLDGDGYDDIATGAPGYTVNGNRAAGAVTAHFGTSSGIASGRLVIHEGKSVIPTIYNLKGTPEPKDQYGWSVAIGNFDGHGSAEIAIGIPHEDGVGGINEGAVAIVPITSSRTIYPGDDYLFQSDFGEAREPYDTFGRSLAVGDFNGDNKDDLAVGAPYEDVAGTRPYFTVSGAGAVGVMYGGYYGLGTGSTPPMYLYQGLWMRTFSQFSVRLAGVAERDDYFGWSLGTGDFNGDGKDDLVVGVPYENIDSITNAGAINVIYGTHSQLTGAGNQFLHRNSPGISMDAVARDRFGWSVAGGRR